MRSDTVKYGSGSEATQRALCYGMGYDEDEIKKGYLRRYAEQVTSASQGAILVTEGKR